MATDELLQGLDGGPRGDDGEDLGGADLFGSDADGSGGGGGDGDGMATPSSNASTTTATATPRGWGQRTRTTTTKTRARTSNVWNDFDELFHVVNGKRTRYAAKCHYCKKILTATSIAGTGHLLRHRTSCALKADRFAKSQSVLHFNGDGSVRNWDYNSELARLELCRMIARLDLPLGIGAYDAFVDYIKRAHNPRYVPVCRQTTTRDVVKLFNQSRTVLMDCLTACSSVAITSDIWNGNAKEDYLSVVAHFVNSDWELEKRLIGLRLIDVSHSGSNIAERVGIVLDEWSLTDKIFSFTLDNASSNASAMTFLTPKFSGYVGSVFLHQRCACHIINLIVKSGLKRLKTYIEAFRIAISFMNSSNQRIAAYKSYCIAMGVRPRKFGLDMDVRWNSTYLMLKHLVPYKSTFSVFMDTHYKQVMGQALLTEDHWYVADFFLSFLEMFYESTLELSGVYYPTAPLMLHHLIDIAGHLNKYENDSLLRNTILPMKAKFSKYWKNIPVLYSFAFVLDPRAKMRGFHKALTILSQLTSNDYSNYYDYVRVELTAVFTKYELRFGGLNSHRKQQLHVVGKKRKAWGKIYGSDVVGGVSDPPSTPESSTPSSSTPSLFESQSELLSYLDSDPVSEYDDDFNILSWWRDHRRLYPVLSILAKDVMTVPVSTISSESTFSLVGRVIEERRRSLTSDMVEMLSCLKDWELGAARQQHDLENQELLSAFEDLYIDEEQEQT